MFQGLSSNPFRVYGRPGKTKARRLLAAIKPHLEDAGVGTISEIFDAEAPHTPRGCIAQAWSVAEILRTYIEVCPCGTEYSRSQRKEHTLQSHQLWHYRKTKSTMYAQNILDDSDNLEAFFNAKGGWQIRPAHWRTDPGKTQEIKEFLDHFYRCLSDLPQRTADAFVFREVDGLSTEEICKHLDITATNCWVLLYRARTLLRKCLELAGFGRQQEGNTK